MPVLPDPVSQTPITPHAGAGALLRDMPAQVLGPLLAGQRARLFADACEMERLPVWLIGTSGRVLHATTAADALSHQNDGGAGSSEVSQGIVRRVLEIALTSNVAPSTEDTHGEPPFHILVLNCPDQSPYQLVQRIAVASNKSDRQNAVCTMLLLDMFGSQDPTN
ncbi:hypothetical protein [Lichenihabitans psoromatis]|uniref:hypothetical protein n=1 Tax=Lichenihabitans psoromatis TaxID=2528642 RepID=UPI0010384CF7|nr:hypothetical protein [Lichenihabitans psoromatis]